MSSNSYKLFTYLELNLLMLLRLFCKEMYYKLSTNI